MEISENDKNIELTLDLNEIDPSSIFQNKSNSLLNGVFSNSNTESFKQSSKYFSYIKKFQLQIQNLSRKMRQNNSSKSLIDPALF